VALVKAMAAAYGAELSSEEATQAAYEAEQLMDIPCGQMDQYSVQIREPIVIDSSVSPPAITPLTVHGQVTILAAYRAGNSCKFADQYPEVRRRWLENEKRVLRYVDQVARVCEILVGASLDMALDAVVLGNAVTQAHAAIIEHLGTANADIDSLVNAAQRAGALGAKSCGARTQGGAMIAVCEPDTAVSVAQTLKEMQATVLTHTYGDAG
jgi:mevalonate kinase